MLLIKVCVCACACVSVSAEQEKYGVFNLMYQKISTVQKRVEAIRGRPDLAEPWEPPLPATKTRAHVFDVPSRL